jgi:hypothetical protein
MLEGYCADIEHLVREGSLRRAVRLAVALPDICAALEDDQMRSSRERYVHWCQRWLKGEDRGAKEVTGERLFRVHARGMRKQEAPDRGSVPPPALIQLRMRRNAPSYRTLGRTLVWQPHNRLEAFRMNLCETLVEATREWYREHGLKTAVVQTNLGKLLMSR